MNIVLAFTHDIKQAVNLIMIHYEIVFDCKYFISYYHPIFVAVTVSKITNDVNWQRCDDYNDWPFLAETTVLLM